MTATGTPADNTPTESTATPQSIEGEPAMTTTTTATAVHTVRENTPDQPSATDSAQGAGIEQRETEHVDGAATDSAAAGTTEDGGRAHRLVWLDPRGLAVHPRNIRDDLGDLSGLADSIAAQGVLEALTVIPHVAADGTPGHQLVAGHRRAAAAILAGLTAVPCVLRPDLALDGAAADGDRAAQAAAVAVYAGDPDTTAALIAAAGEGPGRFAHALTRAKQARAEAERATALLGELTAAGRTVPVDLGDLATGLDRHALTLVLAAIAHAAGSHEPRSITHAHDGSPAPE